MTEEILAPMEPLRSYLGDPQLKAALIAEIAKHEAADMIAAGTYGEGAGCSWRGCAIGCSLRSLNRINGQPEDESTGVHERYPKELGLPLWLAHCEDSIFENLPTDLAHTWPRRFAEAVPVGVDLTRVLAALMRWVLIGETYGVVHATGDAEVKGIVQRMGDLFAREVAGESVPDVEFDADARAARDARAAWAARGAWDAWAAWDARAARDARDARGARAAWAAWAARAAWDARAARDAWDARAARAAWAARDARAAWAARDARAAWDARGAWDAWDAFYPALSEELLRLLRAAGVTAVTP
jgi:hypothetical protein